MWLFLEIHIRDWAGEDDFLKGGEERRMAEFEREAQVSVVQPGMKIQSKTSAPVWGLFRWMCLSGAGGGQTLVEHQLWSLPRVSSYGVGGGQRHGKITGMCFGCR